MKNQLPQLILTFQDGNKKFHTIVCTERETGELDLYARGEANLLNQKWKKLKALVEQHLEEQRKV